ncbi:uncharacterized protein BDV14DRAFT_197679 [Aspergillus stella-maris]|uniref:uncharacterized protein n=1 Tax=Aspergillus stella-maris TaxID=1810926 RepID=UPI003CCCAE38
MEPDPDIQNGAPPTVFQQRQRKEALAWLSEASYLETHARICPNIVEDRYDAWSLKGVGSEDISLEELGNVYKSATAQFQRIYIVLDGVNELEGEPIVELQDALRDIL